MIDQLADAKLGRDATQALPVIEAAFSKARAVAVEKLLSSSPADTANIIALHGVVQAIDAARQAVSQIIATGQFADKMLEKEKA